MARTLMGVVFICVFMTVAGLIMGIPYESVKTPMTITVAGYYFMNNDF